MDLHQKIHLNWTTRKTWILIGILAIFGLGAGIYFFFFQNTFSKENVLFQISGPEESKSGKEVTWLVTIQNKSEIKIEHLSLVFEYPAGVFNKEGEVIKRDQRSISSLFPGEKKSESFSGIIFGKEGEIKKTTASLTYSPQGLSSQFENQSSFSTVINQSLIVFEMKLPQRINPEEDFLVSFAYQSGFSFPLENIQIRFFIPEGFERLSKNIRDEKREEGKIIFNIGGLNEGQGGKIELKGKITGEVGEEKMFRAEFGKFDEKLYEFIPLASSEKTIKIVSSALDIFRKVNGEYNYIASPGEALSYMIDFANTGEDIYRNLTLTINLESNVLDLPTLKAPGGKVEGKKIIFSYENFPDLLFLGPYGEGEVGFSVKVKDDFAQKNAFIKEKIALLTIEKEFKTKISSKTSFKEEIYYDLNKAPREIKSAFQNSGEFPLKIDKETTLVIIWEIGNLGNNLTGSKIRTILPQNVEYSGKVFPENTKVSFDEDQRELVLNIGNIPFSLPSKIFAFQIKITPTKLPQEIIGKIEFTGKDSWTDQILEISTPSLTTDAIQ